MCFFSTPAQVSPLPVVLCRRINVQQVPQNPPYLPASSLLFSYPCSLFLTGLRVSNPFLGVFGHPPPYPKPRSLPPQPILSLHFVCVLPSLCFISHSNSLLRLCSFSVFVGESLQKAHFLGDILPLRLRVRIILGLVLDLGFLLGKR